MNDEHESPWLQERMQELRERRDASAPAFERVWRAARVQCASEEGKVAWPVWRIAGVSVAAVVITIGAVFWTHAEREHHRRIERDFAAVDGALLMYWQAPSDDLLPVGNWNESPEPR
jgi:hypothetical protein